MMDCKRRDVGYLPRTNKTLGARPVVNDDEQCRGIFLTR